MRQDQVTQISDSYSKWIEAAAVSKHFPQSMLSLNDRHQIHLDFVTATDFPGKTYRAYEDLIMVDPASCHAHLANCDKDLERVRCIETFAMSDNHSRSVSGLPPVPYPECQPSQAALEQNSLEYLTSLANFEVGSVLRVMEQPEMYADYVDMSTPSTPAASKTTGSQHGIPVLHAKSSKTIDRSNSNKLVQETLSTVQKENNPAVGFRPIHRPPSMSRSLLSPQVTHSQGRALLDSQNMQGRSVHRLTPVKIVDPSPTLPHAAAPPHVQMQITPVSFASTTQVRTDIPVPPTVNQMVPLSQELRVPLSQITSVASTLNTQTPSQVQEQNTDPCRKCGRNNHKTDKCRKKVTCKNHRKKDHSTKFCTMTPGQEDKCSYCGKGKHTAENCRARKKAEKKAKSAGRTAATNDELTLSSSLTQHSQNHPGSSQSSEMPLRCMPLLVTPAATPTIGQHLQQMARQNDVHAMSTSSQNVPTSEAPHLQSSAGNGWK